MLKAENITKAYNHGNKVALQDFSIEVPEGSIYGLLGPNGAGKTTFIRIINQIIQPDSGTIFINGNRLNLNNIKDIGYMPEERGLYKNMSIGDQLLYFGELKGMSKNDALAEAKKWFEEIQQTTGYIFRNRFGERITTRGIAQQLKNYARRYGLNTNVVYPHSFRHRYAKNFLDAFNDLALLADLMGHESIETTRIYLRRTASEQQAIVDKVITW